MSASAFSDEEALELSDAGGDTLTALVAEAGAIRDRAFGRTITFSPKVFLPLTNLCRNRCDYCSFRRSPGDAGEWTMLPREVDKCLDEGAATGCSEALFCLGDTPEAAFSSYRKTLATLGQSSTVEYLHFGGERALARGLLPHTNAGLLNEREMARLKEVNVSLGLMLENVSARLCQPGMPHHKAPDKRPDKRLAMIEAAGRLKIPFTTGILIGIGETRRERIESLLAIRRLHRAHGHIQEVIVQNFRAATDYPNVPMAGAPEPDESEMVHATAMARLILDEDVGVQAPPNLNPAGVPALLAAGINDLGGISPVTPDYINPGHPWPHLEGLARECEANGFVLRPRLAIYESYIEREGFLDARLLDVTRRAQERLARVPHASRLTPSTSQSGAAA